MEKNLLFKRISVCALVIVALISFYGTGFGKEIKNKAETQIEKNVKKKKIKAEEKSRETIIKEAVEALQQTNEALEAIEKKDKQRTLNALALALGKLELILAREPNLALAPVDVRLETYDVYGDVKKINKAIEEAKELLEDDKIQDARDILTNLASEVDVLVTCIPLATYPDGIKKAAKLINQGKWDEGKNELYDLLNTLVIEKHVIPLPVLRAEAMLKQAKELSEKKGRSTKEEKKLKELLASAKTQLEMAEVLGYGKSSDYEKFYKELAEIEEKTSNKKWGKGFFDKIEKSLSTFKAKIFNKK